MSQRVDLKAHVWVGEAMISDKVKAWLAAGPLSGERIDAPGTDAVRLNTHDATDVFRVVEGALQFIDQTIAALDRLDSVSTPAGVVERQTALQDVSSPLRKVLQEARLGIRAQAEAFKGIAQMFVESGRGTLKSSAGSVFEATPQALITPVTSQKGMS